MGAGKSKEKFFDGVFVIWMLGVFLLYILTVIAGKTSGRF